MFVDVKKYVDFLISYNITEKQFLLCYLLYTDAIDKLPGGRRKYSSSSAITCIYKLVEYKHRITNGKELYWKKEEILDLVNKGLLRQLKADSFDPDMLVIEEKLLDTLFISDIDFDEFWDAYPGFLEIERGKPKARLKSIDKEELQVKYEKIVTTKVYHEKVMSILRWALSKNMVNVGIEKYVMSRQWIEDEKLMKEESNQILSIHSKMITDD